MVLTKKAWFFTVDATVFAVVILSVIYLYTYDVPEIPQTVSHQYVAEDLLGIMTSQHISEIDPSLYAQYQANITDPDFLVIEQLGQWWANNELGLVNSFFSQYTQGIVRDAVGLSYHFNGEAVYQEATPQQRQLASGKRIVSGVEKEKPIYGAVASARATHLKKNTTLVLSMPPEGSGWDRGRVEIIKNFTMPTNITVVNATLVVSVHTDTSLSDRVFRINNCTIPFTSSDYLFWDEGDVGIKDVTSCIRQGNNTWNATFNNNGYNAHTHPGTYLSVEYVATEQVAEVVTTDFSRRYNFDQIRSFRGSGTQTGVWSSMPFFIPPGAKNVSVYIYIAADNVRDYTSCCTSSTRFYSWSGWRNMRDYDYMIFLNQETPFDWDNHPASSARYSYSTQDVDDLLENGTNMLTVYFNNYGDYVWNNQDMILRSSSFVEVNYSLDVTDLEFGQVEITRVVNFGGSADNDKTANFSFPSGAVTINDGVVFLVQRYSNMVDAWADPSTPPSTSIFNSPAPRAVPSELFVPKERLERVYTVQNYIRARDDNGNDILPISQIAYTFGIPSRVGFGNVFATPQEAEADAIDRLQDAMGIYVSDVDIQTTADTITNVPTMWGPAIIEVRTWQ